MMRSVMVLFRPLRAWPGPETPSAHRRSKWTFKVSARSSTHPDRNSGQRVEWDRVEAAARELGVANG